MKKKLKLKLWVKVLIIIMFLLTLLYNTEVKSTSVGDYQCSGNIIQICSGSKDVFEMVGR